MDYIEKILGEKVVRRQWNNADKLPHFISDRYRLEQACIGEHDCLLIIPRDELGTISALKKHINRIQGEWDEFIILELQKLTRQRKESLISNKIPFVVPGRQLFLPFMGVFLQERNDSAATLAFDKLMPSAQMLLFYFIYNGNTPLYISKIPEKFNLSAMTVSRAANQLIELDLLQSHKDGVQKVVTSSLSPKTLFAKARPFLINPVRNKLYLDAELIKEDYFTSGLSALSQRTLLGAPKIATFGTTEAVQVTPGNSQLIDSAKQYELELWKYNPCVLSEEHGVDILSLSVSLSHLRDERVEIAVDEMLENEWSKYGSRI